MREILFRGKRTDNGECVYGNFFHNIRKGVSFNIIYKDTNEWFEVYPETVGQYTGLKDKDGVKIFEGDLIIGNTSYERSDDEREWTKEEPCLVQYSETECGFYPFTLNARWRCDVENIEVVGSIHDKIK